MATTDARQWAASLLGQTVGGRYVLEEVLGVGGMGAVFRVLHRGLQKPFALKLLVPEIRGEAEVVQRFRQEARAAASVGGPGVVAVMDLDEDPILGPYLVMEQLRGLPLNAQLKKALPSLGDIERWLGQTLETLARVHAQNIVHRDLKPANLFLTRDEAGQEQVKIVDFGIARVIRSRPGTLVTMAGTVLGTPRFMAPEQARGLPDVDLRADLYAIGAILYACLAGKSPYSEYPPEAVPGIVTLRNPKPLRELRPGLSEALYHFVDKALARDREQRFPNALTMRAALLQCLHSEAASHGVSLQAPAPVATPQHLSRPTPVPGYAPSLPPATPPPSIEAPTLQARPALSPPSSGTYSMGPGSPGPSYPGTVLPPPQPKLSNLQLALVLAVGLGTLFVASLLLIGWYVSKNTTTNAKPVQSSTESGGSKPGLEPAGSSTPATVGGSMPGPVHPLRTTLNRAVTLQAEGHKTEALQVLSDLLHDARAPGSDPQVGPQIYLEARMLEGAVYVSQLEEAMLTTSDAGAGSTQDFLTPYTKGRSGLTEALGLAKDHTKACIHDSLGRLHQAMASLQLRLAANHHARHPHAGSSPETSPEVLRNLAHAAYQNTVAFPGNLPGIGSCVAHAQTALAIEASSPSTP